MSHPRLDLSGTDIEEEVGKEYFIITKRTQIKVEFRDVTTLSPKSHNVDMTSFLIV